MPVMSEQVEFTADICEICISAPPGQATNLY